MVFGCAQLVATVRMKMLETMILLLGALVGLVIIFYLWYGKVLRAKCPKCKRIVSRSKDKNAFGIMQVTYYCHNCGWSS